MALFRFLRAADLHIDSPLIGLARKSKDFASRIDDASRRAFDNLIALAEEEECQFVDHAPVHRADAHLGVPIKMRRRVE